VRLQKYHSLAPCLFLVPVLFLLASCQSAPASRRAQSYGPVTVSGDTSFSLLAPGHIAKNLDMLQRISGSYGNNHFDMNAWVMADANGISMELFNDMGNSLGQLLYTGTDLAFTSSYFPRGLKAEYAVADFQFCFYRIEALRSVLGNIKLETESAADLERRRFYDGDTLIIEIEKTAASVHYTNHLRSYAYTILGEFP
jgi:hypothetical protein